MASGEAWAAGIVAAAALLAGGFALLPPHGVFKDPMGADDTLLAVAAALIALPLPYVARRRFDAVTGAMTLAVLLGGAAAFAYTLPDDAFWRGQRVNVDATTLSERAMTKAAAVVSILLVAVAAPLAILEVASDRRFAREARALRAERAWTRETAEPDGLRFEAEDGTVVRLLRPAGGVGRPARETLPPPAPPEATPIPLDAGP
ncbi:MAG TPA: hypothetical protein VHH36_08480 [Candidatus Thermoplasmatota archaeon]|nr:hypothetical protein [Candidatus Thermoplasmatota archaeon]